MGKPPGGKPHSVVVAYAAALFSRGYWGRIPTVAVAWGPAGIVRPVKGAVGQGRRGEGGGARKRARLDTTAFTHAH